MTEIIVSAVVAVVSGIAAFSNRINSRIGRIHERINAIDNRIDNFELRAVSTFVQKSDFTRVIEKMEEHMVRIEDKLDQMILRQKT